MVQFHGVKDRLASIKYAQFLDEALPNSRLITVEEADHRLVLTHSDIIAKNILEENHVPG